MRNKVLFVIPYLHDGGAERALSNITTHFPEDWDIDILVNSDKVQDYPYRGNIITLGIDKIKKTDSVFFQFYVFLKRIAKLRKFKSSGEYKACVSFMDSANVSNILAARKKCKTIVSVRVSLKKSESKPQYKYIVSPLVKLFYNKADRVVAVSKGVEEELVDIFGIKRDRVTTIENGYDIDQIKKQSEEEIDREFLEKIDGKKVIITAGRLTEQKGQWHLIRAFNEVIKKVPDAVLVLLGDGELRGYLEELTAGYGISDRVIFVGQTRNPFKYEKYADVFVMPSLYEGFPNALAEAVCLGLPCISTDFETGARDILAPDMMKQHKRIDKNARVLYGYITPLCSGAMRKHSEPLEGEEKELADSMIRILTDEELYRELQETSRCRQDGLSIAKVIESWINIL